MAPGTTIGTRYRLLEVIGEGGMGTVWMAEQREPMRRMVALKLIKPGMASKAVLTRFGAERQALALMDHPNIAKVLDGGTTEDGRPYFVMELVTGIPLTQYCDERRLPVAARLDLFVQVCQAVQHAHQKGIIHRDIKPTNILVTEHDGRPVPKVIDFGLAKALQGPQALTEHTMFTAFGTMVGTPLYMAPEQVGINALDIDTRSDVYALGVILYELLTGSTPLEKQRFKEAAWEEICRLIREEEPPRPSLRLSSSDALPSIAACRHTEPDKARQAGARRLGLDCAQGPGERPQPPVRHGHRTGVDIQRHLANEPIAARPPTSARDSFDGFSMPAVCTSAQQKAPLGGGAELLTVIRWWYRWWRVGYLRQHRTCSGRIGTDMLVDVLTLARLSGRRSAVHSRIFAIFQCAANCCLDALR